MRKNWRKWGKVAFSALVMFTLTACSGSDAEGESEGDSNTLEVSVGAEYIDYVNEIKDGFEQEENVSVQVTEKDMNEQMDSLPLDGPSGLGPDVTMSAVDRIGQGADQGFLSEVEVPEDTFNEQSIEQVTLNDNVYGIPASTEALVMYYNKDLVSEAPETFDDLEEIAQDDQFDQDGDNIGFLANWTDLYFTYGLISGYGGYIFGEDGTDPSDIGLNNEGAVEGIEYAAHWFQDVWPDGMLDVTGATNLISDYFTQGKTAAIISGPWDVGNFNESDIDFGVAKIPELKNGEDYSTFGGGKAWVVSSFSENQELAQEFINYLSTEENQTKFYEVTSEIPTNIQSQDKILDSDDEASKAVIEQFKVSEPMPNLPQMAEVWAGTENMLFDAGSGNLDPKEAADQAVDGIKESIEQKY